MSYNTEWTICGRALCKNGKTFFIRGVNYAPTPIDCPGRLDMLGDRAIYKRDLRHLRSMHANAVKTYDFYSSIDHIPYLDIAYNNGSDPIYTVFSIWIDQTLMEESVSIWDSEFQAMQENYRRMALQTASHPGVMGYSIGGEINSITSIHTAVFWEKFDALIQAVRQGLKVHHAKKIVTTTFVDDGGESFAVGEQVHADVDLWGSNVYQRDYPGSVIPAFMRAVPSKPLLVSEYGFSYASNKGEGSQAQLEKVGRLLLNQSIAMENNFQGLDIIQKQILVGGFVFEYSDEWWKAGSRHEHTPGHTRNEEFPLGYLSEEYFGLFRAHRAGNELSLECNQASRQPDILTARPVVTQITALWARGPLKGEGIPIVNCSLSMETMSNTSIKDNVLEQSICGFALLFFTLLFSLSTILLGRAKAKTNETRRLLNPDAAQCYTNK